MCLARFPGMSCLNRNPASGHVVLGLSKDERTEGRRKKEKYELLMHLKKKIKLDRINGRISHRLTEKKRKDIEEVASIMT